MRRGRGVWGEGLVSERSRSGPLADDGKRSLQRWTLSCLQSKTALAYLRGRGPGRGNGSGFIEDSTPNGFQILGVFVFPKRHQKGTPKSTF